MPKAHAAVHVSVAVSTTETNGASTSVHDQSNADASEAVSEEIKLTSSAAAVNAAAAAATKPPAQDVVFALATRLKAIIQMRTHTIFIFLIYIL